MPRRAPDSPPERRYRTLLIAVALTCGGAAVYLAVFGTSHKQSQIAIILGLWAALIGAFGMPAGRRANTDVDVPPPDFSAIHDQMLDLHDKQTKATQASLQVLGLELRKQGELQLARESASRREADLKLHVAVRQEIERSIAEQFGAFREEVSTLRSEVFEKLGGQIQLERTETTRVIGSNLEALQNEIRRLASDRDPPLSASGVRDKQVDSHGGASTDRLGQATAGALQDSRADAPRPAAKLATAEDIVDAEVVESAPVLKSNPLTSPDFSIPPRPPLLKQSRSAAVSQGRPSPPPAPTTVSVPKAPPVSTEDWGPVRSVTAKVASPAPQSPAPQSPAPQSPAPQSPAPQSPAPQSPAPAVEAPVLPPLPPASARGSKSSKADPFADLPRLSPIPPELLDPEPQPSIWRSSRSGAGPAHEAQDVGEHGRRRAPEDDPSSPRYVGRRRSAAELAALRAAGQTGEGDGPQTSSQPSGRRRASGRSED